jgi:uncharacterized metal-binding protein
MDKDHEFKCSFCGVKACTEEEEKTPPEFCPTPLFEDLIEDTRQLYAENKDARSLALSSARVEAEGYCKWSRVEETIHFAKRLGINNIGIAHCVGLMKEAKVVHQIMESAGFKVSSVCCKVGKTDKKILGLSNDEKAHPGQYESACNPIAQAKLLEKTGSELNIVIGLCVGHDSLFFMHSKVPTTVLIVKDRVLGHNPVAALYTAHSYYKHLKKGNEDAL